MLDRVADFTAPVTDGRDRRCAGQTQYLTWGAADKAMKNIKRFKNDRQHGSRVAPYRCRFCHQWHLGHEQDT